MLGDLGWLLLAGLVCLLHFIKEVGVDMVRRLLAGQENFKVKLLHDDAVAPQKGSGEAAGWDLSTTMPVRIEPGERRLLSTGLAMEIPRGCYGRLASRSSLACQGLDVAGGVIDSDFRGEVKVIMVNHGQTAKTFEVGDRVAQVIIERIAKVPLVVSTQLSSTTRQEGAFGSSGVAARSLRVEGDARRGRGDPVLAGEPHDGGAPGHEGGLRSGDSHVPEGGLEVMRASDFFPESLVFEGVYTSRGG